jgi:hypothetical protein
VSALALAGTLGGGDDLCCEGGLAGHPLPVEQELGGAQGVRVRAPTLRDALRKAGLGRYRRGAPMTKDEFDEGSDGARGTAATCPTRTRAGAHANEDRADQGNNSDQTPKESVATNDGLWAKERTMRIPESVAKVSTYYASTGVAHAFKSGLNATVEIRDQAIKDGFENVFALVPNSNGSWSRFDLEYKRPAQPWLSGNDHTWNLAIPPSGVDAAAVAREGIAFGIEMNGQTTWAQSPGDNFPVSIYR